MEKIVKLLNEYEKSKYGISGSYELEIDDETGEPTGGIIDSSEDYFEVTSYYITMKIISKRFGFIERLVKEDKIKSEYISGGTILANNHQYITYTESEDLIMQLSIQDNPIEYLVSILK